MISIDIPVGFVRKVEDMKMGFGTFPPNEPAGYISFIADGATKMPNEEGAVYLHLGSPGHGLHTRIAIERRSFFRFITAAMNNVRILNEMYKPVGLVLTPLDGTAPISVKTSALSLKGEKLVITDEDGSTRELDALLYTISYEYDNPTAPKAIIKAEDDEDGEAEDEDEDEDA